MIERVILSSGREVGGLNSFANSLAEGFREIGYDTEILPLKSLLLRYNDLRNPKVLKILSTGAVFLSPFCQSCVSVAHGFPRVDAQGYLKTFMIWLSLKLASRHCQTVAVSEYTKIHLQACFNIKIDKVIYNPLNKIFCDSNSLQNKERNLITYIGRFHRVKNISQFINPLKKILKNFPHYHVVFVGHGELYDELRKLIGQDPRFQIIDSLNHFEIKNILLRTKVFFSGCDTEAFGLTYLEALSCGANIVMPHSGGGLEIYPELIHKKIFPFSLRNRQEEMYQALKKALLSFDLNITYYMKDFCPKNIAKQYLKLIEY